MAGHGPTSETALREVVREVVREVLPEARRAGGGRQLTAAPARQGTPVAAGARVEEVRIASDADLAALIARVVALCEDQRARAALREGHHRFRLAASGAGGATGDGRARRRVEKCVLSEARLVELGSAGGELLLDKGVVVTPLARDKARQLGIRLIRSD